MITVSRTVLFLMLLLLIACSTKNNEYTSIRNLTEAGEFEKAEQLLKAKMNTDAIKKNDLEDLKIQVELISRIRKEFPYKRSDVKIQFEKYYPSVSNAQLDNWEESGQLEMRVIDREKRYFKRSVSNFFRLNEDAKKLKESIDGKSYDGVEDFQQSVIPSYFANEIIPGKPFDKRRIKVNYTVTLKPNVVPNGELVKCWLPYPRTGLERLPEVELLGTSQENYIIAPNEVLQRSIYMEKQAEQNKETVFNVSFVFSAAAQWFNTSAEKVVAYDKSSELYKKYTAERLPHLVLSDEIKKLAKSIVGAETNPVTQVKLLYYWLNDNIPWAGALEYSTMPCIPEYVLKNGRGDCGMQTLLFLSLARSLGIPCKWQSGWYLLPQEKNLHDWSEVYFEGMGWVPVDPSFKLIQSGDKRVKEFYLNGLDAYRLIVNDDYGQELYPAKKYYRSEPYDFQRGELEWSGGNLYFDTWTYKMKVEYLD